MPCPYCHPDECECDGKGWTHAMVECWYCGHIHVAVYPAVIEGAALECSACGLMTCYALEGDPEEVC